MTDYLKCKYYADAPMRLEPREYAVTFRCNQYISIKPIIKGEEWPPRGEEWCIVLREDVQEQDHIQGLVRVVVKNKDSRHAQVKIFNAPDNQYDELLVPLSELVSEE